MRGSAGEASLFSPGPLQSESVASNIIILASEPGLSELPASLALFSLDTHFSYDLPVYNMHIGSILVAQNYI